MLFFLLVISLCFYSVFSFDSEESFLFDLERSPFKFFDTKEKKFKSFYKDYFSEIMPYEFMEEAQNRFSFLFHYMEARNIGSLDLKENKQIDLACFKELEEEEKIALVDFYLNTVELFTSFKKFLDKESVENNFLSDSLCVAFLEFRQALLDLPKIEEMNHGIADFSFFIKGVPFSEKEIRNNVFSDVHSSPKYFGVQHEPVERSIYQGKQISSAEDLELFYKEILPRTKTIQRTFFCGDIGGRSEWDLFVRSVDFEKSQKNHLIENKLHEKLYSMWVDFFSLVHAAYQLYCLQKGNTEDIIRFQVFGNHETSEVNKLEDKKDYGLNYFSEMISFLRIVILPTEINFFLSNNSIAVLRHAFFPRSLSRQIHKAKTVNPSFKVIYVMPNLPFEFKSDLPLSYVIKEGLITFNPQYWSDMVPHAGKNVFDFDVLLDKKNDGSDVFFQCNPFRGYENIVSIERAAEEGKKISIGNLIVFNDDYFVPYKILRHMKEWRWIIFFGHNHSLKTLWHSFCLSGNLISMHPYNFENKNSSVCFSLCGYHNSLSSAIKFLSHAFIEKLNHWHEEINQSPSSFIFDFKQGQPVNILSTFFGQVRKIYNKVNEIPEESSVVVKKKPLISKDKFHTINLCRNPVFKNCTRRITRGLYKKQCTEVDKEKQTKNKNFLKEKITFTPIIITFEKN